MGKDQFAKGGELAIQRLRVFIKILDYQVSLD
jgi:hypothetical protein